MVSADLPYNAGVAITPHDSTDIVHPDQKVLTDAINVGGAGTVTVVFQDGSTVQLTLPTGAVLPVKVKRVNATGTAATGLVALYRV